MPNNWSDIDHLVEKDLEKLIVLKDYDLVLEPKCQAITYDGNLLIYPYLHIEWLQYYQFLWNLLEDVHKNRVQPTWDMLAFRSENDYFAASYNLFAKQWIPALPQLSNNRLKYLTYSDVFSGVDLFSSLAKISKLEPKSYHDKFKICTEEIVHTQNRTLIHKAKLKK